MIKRLLLALPALALAVLPSKAEAAWGFTAHQGVEYSTRGYYVSPHEWLPTIDIRTQGQVIQIDALELLSGITTDRLHLGVNYYRNLKNGPVTDDGSWKGAWQLGGSLDVDSGADYAFDALNLMLMAQGRMGMQAHKDFGFGIYVVPGIGIAKGFDFAGDDAFDLAVGGQVQISTWIK